MQNEHIYAGIGYGLGADSDEFQYGSRYIDAFVVLFWIFGTIEFLIMFHGATLFSNSANLLQICFHMAGVISLLHFKTQMSHYKFMLPMCIAFGLVPLLIEKASGIKAVYNYRRV